MQRILKQEIVTIEHRDKPAACMTDPRIARGSKTSIPIVPDNPESTVEPGVTQRDGQRVVERSVIDDNTFPGFESLLQDASQTRIEPDAVVAGRHDHTHLRIVGLCRRVGQHNLGQIGHFWSGRYEEMEFSKPAGSGQILWMNQ